MLIADLRATVDRQIVPLPDQNYQFLDGPSSLRLRASAASSPIAFEARLVQNERGPSLILLAVRTLAASR
jgi:hypothetical protein